MKILAVCGAQGALFYKLRKCLVANVEPRSVFHTPSEEQWKLNFGDIPFVRTLSELSKKQTNGVDLIIGSPSCGHSSMFSYSRKKSLGKPKEDPTLNLFIESVVKIRPKLFLLENLPKLLELIPLEEWEFTLSEYKFIIHCHSVAEFGNSQVSRKRLILIGIRKDQKQIKESTFEIFKVKEPITCKILSSKIRPNLDYREAESKTVSMYYYSDKARKSLPVSEVKKLWIGEFKDHYRWPMFGHKMKSLPGVYRNRNDKYPLTLRPSNRQFNEDGSIIGLEGYRVIMGFPKSYRINFDSTNPTYWLNKGRIAYTKGSVFEVGSWFKRCLKKVEL